MPFRILSWHEVKFHPQVFSWLADNVRRGDLVLMAVICLGSWPDHVASTSSIPDCFYYVQSFFSFSCHKSWRRQLVVDNNFCCLPLHFFDRDFRTSTILLLPRTIWSLFIDSSSSCEQQFLCVGWPHLKINYWSIVLSPVHKKKDILAFRLLLQYQPPEVVMKIK